MNLNKCNKKTHNLEDKIKSEQQKKYYKRLIQRTENQHVLQELSKYVGYDFNLIIIYSCSPKEG